MGPNDAEVIRTYTSRVVGSGLADETLRLGGTPVGELVVETAFGSAFAGTMSEIGATIVDQTTCTPLASYGPVAWPATAGPHTQTWAIPAGSFAGLQHHVCEAIVYLLTGTVGPNEPDTSIAEFTFVLVP